MANTIRAALVQTDVDGRQGDDDQGPRGVRPRGGRPGREGHLLPGAVLRAVLLPGAGRRSTTSTPSRSPARPPSASRRWPRSSSMVMVLPMYEQEQPGVLYNTAAVVDADGTYLGKYRKHHIPQVKGFWEKFYFRPGNLGYPVFDTAVGQGRRLHLLRPPLPRGLAGARAERRPDRVQPVGHQPRPVGLPVEARAAGVGRRQRVLHRRHQPRRHRAPRRQRLLRHVVLRRPRGQVRRRAGGRPRRRSSSCATSTWTCSPRSATAGRSTATAAPTPTATLARPNERAERANGPSGRERGATVSTTLITGGTVIATTGVVATDVLVDGETIAALYAPGAAAAAGLNPDRTIDATGKYVVPGGIDVHTHMELPFGGTFASDTFETGTRAAACGRHHDHRRLRRAALRRRGRAGRPGAVARQGRRQLRHRLRLPHDPRRRRRRLAEGHGLPRRPRGHHQLQAVHGLPRRLLQRRRPDPAGHAEGVGQRRRDHDARRERHRHRRAGAQALARGETDPKYHGITRRSELEGEATNRAIVLADVAGNCPLYIVHMSATEALEAVAAARHEGANVFAETCPQYLYLTLEDHLARPASRAPSGCARRRCAPSTPITSRPVEGPAHQRAGLRLHRPLPVLHQGPEGAGHRRLLQDPERHRRRRAPDGPDLPGRRQRRASSLTRWVETCAPRRRACSGSTRRRASSPPARDADIVIYDPNGRTEISFDKRTT